MNNRKRKILCLNLKRRDDRKREMIQIFEDNKVNGYEFYEATDGKEIVRTEYLTKLFEGNNFRYRRGESGCALSHYNIWIDLLKDETNDYYIVFEDDVVLCNNFITKLDYIENDLEKIEWDIYFIGYHVNRVYLEKYKKIYRMDTNNIISQKLNMEACGGGTFGYIINKKGAQKMVDNIKENKIRYAIDYLIIKNDNLIKYEAFPNIVFSEIAFDNTDKGDIQYHKSTMYDNPIDAKQYDDYEFYPNKDSDGYDIMYVYLMYLSDNNYIDTLKAICDSIPNSVGFNTYGYIKYKVDVTKLNEIKNIYFKNDGIYIKKKK